MPKNTVEYVASLPRERDDLEIGRAANGGACVIYRRFGRIVASFVASPGQLKKIRGGSGTLNITSNAIDKARRYGCPGKPSRQLSGARRKR